jgi:hypothetical protein
MLAGLDTSGEVAPQLAVAKAQNIELMLYFCLQ